ncbi:MAG: serine/threonine-protein kinase [Cyanobacteria bacterium P01_E01_bin.42]
MNELHRTGDIVCDRYRILSLLGEGSTGSTYKAIDLIDSQTVAIKVVSFRRVRDWKVLELFEREAKILASLEHPAIPKYFDYFHQDTPEDRRFYLIRELIEGNSLTIEITSGWHPQEAEVKEIAKQLLNILIYLHGLNPPVIHRDIKPENIIRDANEKVFLVDFGGVQEIYRKTLSRSGTFVGTVGYMPPEQFRGKAIFASDLYALGTTLLYLLARCSPEDLPQKRMKIDFHSHVSISKKFARWLEKAIEPAIEDRFHSVENALKILEEKQTLALRYEQPKYSRILIENKSNNLIINIPGKSWDTMFLLNHIIIISFLGLIFYSLFWIIRISKYAENSILGIVLVLFIIGILYLFFLAKKGLKKITTNQVFIDIRPKEFQFQQDFFNHAYIIQGQTSGIKKIEHSQKSKSLVLICKGREGSSLQRILVKEKDITHFKRVEFGSWFKQAERDWLQAEITEFLENL